MMNKFINCRHQCVQKLSTTKLVIPNWLNEKFVEKALENGKDFSVKIDDMKIDMAAAKGSNYVCNVYRVSANYRKSGISDDLCTIALIIKSPIYGKMYELFIKNGIEKEVKMYKELIPKLETLYHEKRDDTIKVPKSFFSSQENVVILEDLKSKGYVVMDRNKRFDMRHCHVALKALAKFHAGCAVVHEKEPKLVEELGKEILFRQDIKEVVEPVCLLNVKYLSEELQNHSDLKKYTPWLEKVCVCGFDKVAELMKPRQHEFNVLNHGDYGLQNMLIKYTNESPIEIVPIDFQTCRFITPAMDFIHFTEFTIQEEVRDDKLDELLRIYVTELNRNLEKYGSKEKLEILEFKKSIHERDFLRVFYNIAFLGLIADKPSESQIFALDDLAKEKLRDFENKSLKTYLKSKRFIETFKKRLKQFEEMGLVELNK